MIAIVVLVSSSACSSPPVTDASTDALDDFTTDASASDVATGCPDQLPADGVPCAPLGRSCEYGAFSWHDCNSYASCTTRGWVVHAPLAAVCAPNNTMCPASASAITAGSACDNGGLECFFRESTCYCPRPATGDAGTVWTCDAPAPGCPSPRPFVGSACSTEGQECDYAACLLHNVRQRCQGGVWVEAIADCDGG